MQVSKAADLCLKYQRTNPKGHAVTAYEMILFKFCCQFGENDLYEINIDNVVNFPA